LSCFVKPEYFGVIATSALAVLVAGRRRPQRPEGSLRTSEGSDGKEFIMAEKEKRKTLVILRDAGAPDGPQASFETGRTSQSVSRPFLKKGEKS
jgi:hypothetical protein